MEKVNKFYKLYNEQPSHHYQAPARVNLIGEHIDYNGGRVLPCAISLYIDAYFSARNDRLISVSSGNEKKYFTVSLDEIKYEKKYSWANYVFGCFYILRVNGYKIDKGLNIYINSEIPVGSGLSSSAALLDLIIFAINDINNLGIDRENIAKLAQKVENQYCNLKCGIMDQAIIALGKEKQCLLLDCNNFSYDYVNLNLGEYTFVILKTNKPHSLVTSKYNERVSECEKALAILKQYYNINSLCDLRTFDLTKVHLCLDDDVLYRRVKHVITENERVISFCINLEKGNIAKLGELLNASHQSLKNNYEVTGEHLDAIVESALIAGAVGARMTGGGFGGCAIALIKLKDFETFREKVSKRYQSITNIIPDIIQFDIVDGVKRI